MKPLLIGKSRQPRCFINISTDSLPVHYYYNSKAWMTSQIYEDYLKTLNRKMKAEKRNIILFVDNAPSHPALKLSNIRVHFLPPNTTCFTQPMDQGIIQALKLKFRKRQLLHMVKEMDNQPAVSGTDLLKQLNVLDVVYWVDKCWKEVDESTIQKCFHKAGFGVQPVSQIENTENSVDCDAEQTAHQDDEEDDIPLAVLRLSFDLYGCSFKNLPNFDADTHTCDQNTIDWEKPASDLLKDLKKESNKQDSDSDSDHDDDVCEKAPTSSEANTMVTKLKLFAVEKGHPNLLSILSDLDHEFSVLSSTKSKQSQRR